VTVLIILSQMFV